jgi:hypothetical protein
MVILGRDIHKNFHHVGKGGVTMPTHEALYHRAIILSGVLVLAVCTTSALAQQKIQVSGKMTMSVAKYDSVTVGDDGNHYFAIQRSVGTDASTGEHAFMDGAKVVNVSFSDIAQGGGPHHGYGMISHGEGTVTTRWKGHVTIAPGKDAPVISFEGMFTWMQGTGKFATISGTGTYKGHYTSPTTYEVEWTGEYSLGK